MEYFRDSDCARLDDLPMLMTREYAVKLYTELDADSPEMYSLLCTGEISVKGWLIDYKSVLKTYTVGFTDGSCAFYWAPDAELLPKKLNNVTYVV